MKVLSCLFVLNTVWVKLKMEEDTLISVNCTAVENEIADNMYRRSEQGYLIDNAPIAYATLILKVDPRIYLKT